MDIADQGYVQTTFYYHLADQVATNIRTWQWKAGVAGSPTNTTRIDSAINSGGITAAIIAMLPTDAKFDGIRYEPIPNTGALAPIYSNLCSGTGTAGAAALPKQCTALIRFKTLKLGKRGENRIYFPFPPSSANGTDGLPNAGYIAQLLGLALLLANSLTCLSTTGGSGALQPVVNANPGDTLPLTPIAAGLAGTAWATQKRRGDYGKTNKSPFF